MKRLILITLGWVCVGLGFVGIFVPGIPTTIFLIIALWAFTKTSKKLRHWLIHHKRFGPFLSNWQEHKVVPLRAKILMVILQTSVVIIIQYTFDNLMDKVIITDYFNLIVIILYNNNVFYINIYYTYS